MALADSQKGRPRAGTRSRLMFKVLVGGGLDVSLAIPGRGSNHAGGHRWKIAKYAVEDWESTRFLCLFLLLTGSTAPVVASRDDGARAGRYDDEVKVLTTQISFLEEEIAALRRRLADSPRQTRLLEERLREAETNLASVTGQNERMAGTLREARDQIVALKEEVDRLAQPPSGFGIFLEAAEDGTADVFTGGRKMRVSVSPGIDIGELKPGQEVVLNEALNVVIAQGYETVGEVVMLKEILDGGDRALVISHADEERIARLAEPLRNSTLRGGDSLLLEPRSGYVYERIPKAEVEELILEEVPDITYSEIGGLAPQIEQIRDAIELPYLHADLFKEHQLKPPKGVLLYGPPGCGKTLIAKAVANSLAKQVAARTAEQASADGEQDAAGQAKEGKSFFLNIKGPELLNKYVGETERHIRLVFQRAREKASEGMPVIVFFDEMDSIFRTRGSGVSSDVENTIVPQLLSEIDGVEGLENVIVIGASNREDMIDPAILRPGRLDVKIKIERPDAEAAKDIFSKYVVGGLPLHPDDLAEHGGSSAATVDEMIQRRRRRPRLPDQAAGRLLGGRGRPVIHAEMPDPQHLRRVARRIGEVPPPARAYRRTFPMCHDSSRV